MVDRDDLVALAPHYLAMLVLAFGVLIAIRVTVERLNFWVETGLVVLVLLLYRPAVRWLGVAPRPWRERP